jgi:hypothetical protein
MIVATGLIVAANRQFAAEIHGRQFAMHRERQPKGNQPQCQQSGDKRHPP